MITFGETLRLFREASNDPDRGHRRLSQGRLGELIGHEMSDRGFSGAAISDWEQGKSKIRAENRNILIALIKVLYRSGGIKTVADANQLLETGDYRALNKEEGWEIFGDIAEEPSVEGFVPKQEGSKSVFSFLVESLLKISQSDLREAFAIAEEGPAPSWPRKLALLMRKGSERWSLSVSSVFWVATWALAWWMISPSLHWPFADHSSAFSAIVMYMGGTLAVPLLIGSLVNTKDSAYWKQQGLANSKLLRLYTYQGAAIGFNLGYFLILPLSLGWYYLQFGSSIWLELTAVTLGLVLGNMGARAVPHNLWLAYDRLLLKDGAIFFVAAFVGLLWGLFFLGYYPVLLQPIWGGIVILAALLLLLLIPVGRPKKKIDTEQAR